MATLEFGGEMAAGQQTAVQPYMFEPESDPEQEDVAKREDPCIRRQSRSAWLSGCTS